MKPSLRKGVLPSILAALIQARTATRAVLKDTTDPARRAVLDSRQKALKVRATAVHTWGKQTYSSNETCSSGLGWVRRLLPVEEPTGCVLPGVAMPQCSRLLLPHAFSERCSQLLGWQALLILTCR